LSHGRHRSRNTNGLVDRSARIHLDRRRTPERTIASLCRGLRVSPAQLDGVAGHRAGRPADDDVTVLVLHHNAGPTPCRSVGKKLDVYEGLRAEAV
jgi:aminopeptidase N